MGDRTSMIESSILSYYDHLGDTEYVAKTFRLASHQEVAANINSLLESENLEALFLTCNFITGIMGCSEDVCQEFVDSDFWSTIVKILEHLLLSNNHLIRKEAVKTLRIIRNNSNVDALIQAFKIFRDTDPILLPRLIGAMAWLEVENFWEFVEEMANSQSYLTRWAVLRALEAIPKYVIGQTEIDPHIQGKLKYIGQLRQDSHTLVRREAEYRYQVQQHQLEINSLSEAECHKKRQELNEQCKQVLTFAEIECSFDLNLSVKDVNNYSLNELEAFIEERIKLRKLRK
ncbi:MAG: hypothetical protein WBB28_03395 [Crinalium sp.]